MKMKSKVLAILLIPGVVFLLSILPGSWTGTYAQTTIPTVPTARPHQKHDDVKPTRTIQLGELECLNGTLARSKPLQLFFFKSRSTISADRWGGVLNPKGSACQVATETVCMVPVNLLPGREQLNYYRQGLEVRQYKQGEIDPTESCAPKQVYFDLTRYERFMFDNYSERFFLFTYNPDQRVWETCPDITLDEKQGEFGRLICSTTKWGYFALGWPAKK